ncbi:MAG: hypothetical protein M3Z35_02245, partial [Nitrospirota bacterium]|nr:hypothetical protein [Nitrospirota bacterium]
MKRIAIWISLPVVVFFALGEVPTSHSEPMPASPAQALPLSKVVLYSSGVGYFKILEEKAYQIKNRDQKAKTLLIEHPYRAGWQLVEPATSTE